MENCSAGCTVATAPSIEQEECYKIAKEIVMGNKHQQARNYNVKWFIANTSIQ
jgi:hypothetical protein